MARLEVVHSTDEPARGKARPALRLEAVSMVFGQAPDGLTVFENISLDVFEGEILCIVGASGCGKTTLLRQMAGLQRPTSGQIMFGDTPVAKPSRQRAMVFQDYGRALLPWRTVRANIALSLEGAGRSRVEIDKTVDELMAKTGLTAAAQRYPAQLSGGMQQRVQIARAIAQDPAIILMDEPFGALDALTRHSLQDELLAIAQDRGMTVVFITHDLEEAIYLGDRVIVLGSHPGRILKTVPVPLARPRDQLTTREAPEFLGLRHELHGLIEGH